MGVRARALGRRRGGRGIGRNPPLPLRPCSHRCARGRRCRRRARPWGREGGEGGGRPRGRGRRARGPPADGGGRAAHDTLAPSRGRGVRPWHPFHAPRPARRRQRRDWARRAGPPSPVLTWAGRTLCPTWRAGGVEGRGKGRVCRTPAPAPQAAAHFQPRARPRCASRSPQRRRRPASRSWLATAADAAGRGRWPRLAAGGRPSLAARGRPRPRRHPRARTALAREHRRGRGPRLPHVTLGGDAPAPSTDGAAHPAPADGWHAVGIEQYTS